MSAQRLNWLNPEQVERILEHIAHLAHNLREAAINLQGEPSAYSAAFEVVQVQANAIGALADSALFIPTRGGLHEWMLGGHFSEVGVNEVPAIANKVRKAVAA